MAGSTARNAAFVGLTQVAKVVLAFVSLATLSRILEPSAFGIFAMTVAITGIAGLFRDFGLSLAAIQAPTLTTGQRSNLFWTNTGVGVLLFGVFSACAPLIAGLYNRPEIAPAVIVVASAFVLDGATSQYRVGIIRDGGFGLLTITDVSSQAISLATGIVLALSGAGFWALVAMQVAGSLSSLIISVALKPWLPGLPDRTAPLRSFLGFGANLLGVQLLTYLGRNIDNILLGRFWGAQQLGFYSRAYTLYAQPQAQAIAPFTDLAVRSLSAALDDPIEYRRRLYTMQLVSNYVALTIFACLFSMADPIVRIILGPDWGETARLLQILSIGGLAQTLGNVAYWIFLSQAKTAVLLRCSVVTQPMAILAIVGGLPWGATGVAWGATVGMILEWIVPATYGISKTSASVRELFRNLIRPCLYALGLTASVWFGSLVPGDPLDAVRVLTGVLAGAVFTALLSLSWPAFREDLQLILRYGKRLRSRRARVVSGH